MLIIISLILIFVCLIILAAIVIKKLPALAILDIENMPEEKEARIKDDIIRSRVERDINAVSGAFARFFLEIKKFISNLFDRGTASLKKMKINYMTSQRLPHQKKEKHLKNLMLKSEELVKAEDYVQAESKLVELISFDARNLWAFFELATVYEELRKYTEARQTYEYALKLAKQGQTGKIGSVDVNAQEVYFSLALLEKKAGNIQAAYDNVYEALDLEQNNPRFLDLILELSIIKKDKVSAWQYLNKLSEVNPENKKLDDRREDIEDISDSE